MSNYRRYRIPSGTCFLTVNLLERHHNDPLVRHINTFRQIVRETRQRWLYLHQPLWVVDRIKRWAEDFTQSSKLHQSVTVPS